MRNAARLAALAAAALLAVWGCSEEDEPVTGTLTGRVIFHGQWPDSGTVQLSIFQNWSTTPCSWCAEAAGGPPSYYTEAHYFHDPDTTNGDGPDTMTYAISGIALGTYGAVAIGWRASLISDVACDEPVIGLYGADPFTTDSIPQSVAFTSAQPMMESVDVHAYFNIPTPAGCDSPGTISGVVRVNEPWPTEGLLVLITTFPFTPWHAPTGAPAYFPLLTSQDTVFQFTPRYGTYYLSIWNNVAPPTIPFWYGSYGVRTAQRDARPDGILLNALHPEAAGIVLEGQSPPPHYISGNVAFNGTRPAEGLLVLFSTFMYTPEHPPTGAPSGYYAITNPSETLYAMTGLPAGTYYVSLWNNLPPPNVPTFYGAYGYTAGSDVDPDPVTLGTTAATWGVTHVDISGNP
jgi:hypothetical protein